MGGGSEGKNKNSGQSMSSMSKRIIDYGFVYTGG